jgi:hypothetical protein
MKRGEFEASVPFRPAKLRETPCNFPDEQGIGAGEEFAVAWDHSQFAAKRLDFPTPRIPGCVRPTFQRGTSAPT